MRLLFTCRFLKRELSKKASNLLKYMATRESVEIYHPKKNELVLGGDFKKVVNKLVDFIPESKKYFEYEDYINAPTAENAAELVSEILEQNADKFYSREKLISYMAERPGVVRNGKHGLFSQSDGEIALAKVMNEVREHEGNIWTHVVSLRREDAERLGYNNPEAWRQLILRNINTIAEESKIDLHNLKWYAAFHNTAHHPHIHLVVYSKSPKQGYLMNDGIEKIRSKLTNDVFKDELTVIYQKQTKTRNLIKEKCLEEMARLQKSIDNNSFEYANINALIEKLQSQLKVVTGKKVYGYLPKTVKATVNEILSEIANNPVIAKMYEGWCEYEQEKYHSYTNRDKEIAPLERQDAFKSIKNMIIKAALSIESVNDFNDFEISPDDVIFSKKNDIKGNSGKNEKAEAASKADTAPKVRTASYKPLPNYETNKSYSPPATNAAFSLLKALGRMISADYSRKWSGQNFDVDRKLKRVIDKQKEAMGIQIDRTMEQNF